MDFTMYGICPVCGCMHDDGMLGESFGFFCMDCADKLPSDWREHSLEELRELLGHGPGGLKAA